MTDGYRIYCMLIHLNPYTTGKDAVITFGSKIAVTSTRAQSVNPKFGYMDIDIDSFTSNNGNSEVSDSWVIMFSDLSKGGAITATTYQVTYTVYIYI